MRKAAPVAVEAMAPDDKSVARFQWTVANECGKIKPLFVFEKVNRKSCHLLTAFSVFTLTEIV
jgi:hypothetical protein